MWGKKMEVNKDEAMRCLDLAVQYFMIGEEAKALKFASKAEKLFSTDRGKELLSQIQAEMNRKASNRSELQQKTKNENIRPNKAEEKSVAPEYTPQQLQHVQRIKKCKDYYEILQVTKEATDTEIKKAYKKLALHLHPDKNRAPGASEAFKAIGNAVAILTDVEKRKKYDLYGSAPEKVVRRNHGNYEYTRGFEADLSAEELFNMFFGSGFSSPNHVFMRRTGTRWQRANEDDHPQNVNGSGAFFQLLPILILLIISLFSGLFVSDPLYSLTPNSKYPVARRTVRLNVPYYVRGNFRNEFEGSLNKLEMHVEEDFLIYLKQNCFREQNDRETTKWKAKYFGDQELMDKANKMPTPSCDEFTKYSGHRIV